MFLIGNWGVEGVSKAIPGGMAPLSMLQVEPCPGPQPSSSGCLGLQVRALAVLPLPHQPIPQEDKLVELLVPTKECLQLSLDRIALHSCRESAPPPTMCCKAGLSQ